ncbi:hypothetical protein ABIA69_001927 [Lysinibacillus parviboronicapiens]|uniref:Uncharacterized protein n=1 Tax=Lysinibacillus parviboronicapiens TaxID=436516 RepID=A0ABV2PIM2_9BACI
MDEKSSWNSIGDELVKCPVDGCDHIGHIITKVHCRMAHNMTRGEVRKKYGMPTRLITKSLRQVKMEGARND